MKKICIQAGETKWAYIAGLVDCDGWITIKITDQKNKPNPKYEVEVGFSNTDPTIINWLKSEFGGYLRKRDRIEKNWKPEYQWQGRNVIAEFILSNCYKYLLQKREQASVALEFRERINDNKGCKLTEYEIDCRNKLKEKINQLNKRGLYV